MFGRRIVAGPNLVGVTGPALAEVPLTVLSLHEMCRRVPPHRGGKFATALPCGR